MKFEKNEINKLILNYICILLTFKIIKICFSIQGFSYAIITVLFALGIAIARFYENKLKRLDKKLLFTMGVLVVTLLATIMFRDAVVGAIWNSIINPMQKINTQLSKGLATEFSEYRIVFFIVAPILTAIYYSLIKNKLTDIILFLNYTFMLAYWYLNYKTEIKASIVWVALYSFIIISLNTLIGVNDSVKRKGTRNSISNKKVYTLIIVISLVMAFITNAIPKDRVGKYGDYINDKVMNEYVNNSSSVKTKNAMKSQYNMVSSGYSNTERKLGGPININKKEVFKVKGIEEGTPVYFRGNVKTRYIGDRWVNRDLDFKSSVPSNQELIERLSSMGGIQKQITVYPEFLNTTTVFTPNYSVMTFLNSNKDEVFVDKDTNIFYSKVPVKKPYTVKYLDYNFMRENIKNITFSKEGDSSSYSLDMEENLYIPDTITSRTKALAYDIVKGANTNYEKAEKIKEYLTKNYKYTTQVKEVPENWDFVDYFLFEEKKGYCVYFATAYTILNRIVSVPARYVEGFKLSDSSKERLLEDGSVKVTNEDAHAWSEVLLTSDDKSKYLGYEKFWVEMDTSPTPYDESLKNKESNKENPEETSKETFKKDTNDKKVEQNEKKQVEVKEENMSNTNNTNFIKVKVLGIIVCIVAILFLIYRRNRKLNYILKSKSNKAFYIYSLKLMKKNNLIKDTNQTDMEFAKTIQDSIVREKFVKLVEVVYRETYGSCYEDYDKEGFYQCLKAYLKKRDGVIKYYLRKVIKV